MRRLLVLALLAVGCRSPSLEGPPPSVTLTISPGRLVLGDSATVSWIALESEQCHASAAPALGSGAWSGDLPPQSGGGRVVAPASAGTFRLAIECRGPGGNASASQELVVDPPPDPPTESRFTLEPSAAFVGESVTLEWAFDGHTGCTASGAWTGPRPVRSTEEIILDASGAHAFRLVCSGPAGLVDSTLEAQAIEPDVEVIDTFSPNHVTIAASEGAPYGDADFWTGVQFLDRAHGYGPTRVVRLYICLNAQVPVSSCSATPRPTGPIPPTMVAALRERFAAFAAAGVRLVPRFIYNFGPIGAADVPVDVALEHLGQVAPILLDHRDAILALQAGFFGTWGEWHHSTNGNEAASARAALLDRELALFGGHFPVLLRYPADLAEYTGTLQPNDYFGLHNDYYASGAEDGGTWTPRGDLSGAVLQQLAEAVARHTMLIGEFGAVHPPEQTCEALDAYARRMPLQSVGLGVYPPEVAQGIEAQGCLLDFLSRVGVRLEIDRLTLLGPARSGATLSGTLALRNAGYGRVIRPRTARLMLHSGTHVWAAQDLPLDALDLRGLPAMATSALTVPFAIEVPDSVPTGTVTLSLTMPDPSVRLSGDPRHALPLNSLAPGGEEVFDAVTGWNRLATFTVLRRPAAVGGVLAGAQMPTRRVAARIPSPAPPGSPRTR